MARILINMTSLKFKLLPDLTIVGGKVNVALISKESGFIWGINFK